MENDKNFEEMKEMFFKNTRISWIKFCLKWEKMGIFKYCTDRSMNQYYACTQKIVYFHSRVEIGVSPLSYLPYTCLPPSKLKTRKVFVRRKIETRERKQLWLREKRIFFSLSTVSKDTEFQKCNPKR